MADGRVGLAICQSGRHCPSIKQTAMRPVNLVLFGDQAVEKLSSIRALVHHARTSAGAKRLLQEATDLIQIHLNELSEEDRAWKHDFDSLLGLAEDNAAAPVPNAVLATTLMCIGRLGELIVYVPPTRSHIPYSQSIAMLKKTLQFLVVRARSCKSLPFALVCFLQLHW